MIRFAGISHTRKKFKFQLTKYLITGKNIMMRTYRRNGMIIRLVPSDVVLNMQNRLSRVIIWNRHLRCSLNPRHIYPLNRVIGKVSAGWHNEMGCLQAGLAEGIPNVFGHKIAPE